jgi:molybdate transport system substrate-binding protein
MRHILAFLLLIAALVSAPVWADDAKPLVFAAASLKGPLDEAAAAFTAETGIELSISYAGSNTLAKQIEAGAGAHLFISADEDWMNHLAAVKLIASDSRIDLLSNELALIAPVASTTALGISPGFALSDAIGDSKLAMADPDAVPAGKYGKAALTALGVWDAVSPKVARAENVRAALALVATGEAAFGIVYVTDAKAEAKVRTVGVFAANTHPQILYPAALTVTPSEAAAKFLTFLRGETATAVFAKAGFGRPAS